MTSGEIDGNTIANISLNSFHFPQSEILELLDRLPSLPIHLWCHFHFHFFTLLENWERGMTWVGKDKRLDRTKVWVI